VEFKNFDNYADDDEGGEDENEEMEAEQEEEPAEEDKAEDEKEDGAAVEAEEKPVEQDQKASEVLFDNEGEAGTEGKWGCVYSLKSKSFSDQFRGLL